MNYSKIAILFCLGVLLSCTGDKKKVPVVSTVLLKNSSQNKVDAIEIRSHLNTEFNINDLKGKTYVVNFFFASCPTICPAMETALLPYVRANNDVTFLSFTIDPENDTVPVLNAHFKSLAYKGDNWLFLRTSKLELTEIARLYLSPVREDESNFHHTSTVVLVDKQNKIRGLYDVLEAEELNLFKEDLAIVKNE